MTRPKTSTIVGIILASLYLVWVIKSVKHAMNCGSSAQYCLGLSLILDGFPWWLVYGFIFAALRIDTSTSLESALSFYKLCAASNFFTLLFAPRLLAKWISKFLTK